MARAWLWFAAGAGAVLAWAEWLNRRWSRRLAGPDHGGGTVAVVVLGYRNGGSRLNVINRWRVRAAVRCVAGEPGGARLVCSGGSMAGGPAQAHLMAEFARSVLGDDGPVLVEDRSRSTCENVANVIPLVEDVDRIMIVSQPAHALKARGYLWQQRPDLAARLVSSPDHGAGGWFLLRPVVAVHGLRTQHCGRAESRPVTAPDAGRARRRRCRLPVAGRTTD